MTFQVVKNGPENRVTSVIFLKLLIENNSTRGENSPNLVALKGTE
jgi:hypothetical protein